MCTETFLRLPEEKRNRVLNAAWEEFTTVPYARASINQIVRRAGIPRGSFYQYFTDKTDIFSYLLNDTRRYILDITRNLLKDAKGDVFRASLMAYDRFLEQRISGTMLPFDRCFRILRINPGIELESLLPDKPEDFSAGDIMKSVDLSRLRHQDETFVLHVCCLTGVCVGRALMDIMTAPEEGEEHRKRLAEMLEIIQWGCQKAS